jgi:hypothetical protein
VRDVVDDVLVDLHVVGHLDQRVELDAELVLRGRHFVVVLLGFTPIRPSPSAFRRACPAALSIGGTGK